MPKPLVDITYPKSTVQLFIESQQHNEEILSLLNGKELNKSTLADICRIGYSIVHRTDLGLYDSIPPKLNAFFKSISGEERWNVQYLNYKKALLSEHKLLVQGRLWLVQGASSYSSWTQFRELVAESQMEFAKLFLINPAILQHFETGQTKNLPIVIKNRLKYFGMAPETIDMLSELPVGEKTISGW